MSAAPTPGTPPTPTTPTGPWVKIKAHPIKVTVWLLIGIAIFIAAYIFVPKLYHMISNPADDSPPPATAPSDSAAAKPADPTLISEAEKFADLNDYRNVNLPLEWQKGNTAICRYPNSPIETLEVYTIELYLDAPDGVPIIKKCRQVCFYVVFPDGKAPDVSAGMQVLATNGKGEKLIVNTVGVSAFREAGGLKVTGKDFSLETDPAAKPMDKVMKMRANNSGKSYGLIQFQEFRNGDDVVMPPCPIKCWYRIQMPDDCKTPTTVPTK